MYTLPNDIFSDQIAAYYIRFDAKERQAFLSANPELPGCLARIRWLTHRFFTLDQTGEKDLFMRAWVLLLADSANRPGFFSRKHREKELEKLMQMLGVSAYPTLSKEEQSVLYDEWKDFTRQLAQVSLGSRAYGTTVLGMMPMKEEQVERKFAEDIVRSTKAYPRYFGRESDFEPLYEAMREVCVHYMPKTAEVFQ